MYLKTEGDASVDDLASALSMTASAIRQHIVPLEAEGLVDHVEVGSGPGRRKRRYHLTDEGDALFPDHRGSLATACTAVLERLDPAMLRRLIGEGLRAQFRPWLREIKATEDRRWRLARLVEMFEENDFLPLVENGDGRRAPVLRHCPFFGLARSSRAVCEAELEVIREEVPWGAGGAHVASPCGRAVLCIRRFVGVRAGRLLTPLDACGAKVGVERGVVAPKVVRSHAESSGGGHVVFEVVDEEATFGVEADAVGGEAVDGFVGLGEANEAGDDDVVEAIEVDIRTVDLDEVGRGVAEQADADPGGAKGLHQAEVWLVELQRACAPGVEDGLGAVAGVLAKSLDCRGAPRIAVAAADLEGAPGVGLVEGVTHGTWGKAVLRAEAVVFVPVLAEEDATEVEKYGTGVHSP